MSVLSRLSIAQSMVAIAAAGLVTVLFYAGFNIVTEVRKARATEHDTHYAEVAGAVSTMIHELQKERGASAGFLASKGANFADTLPKQRAKSDEVIAAFRETADRMRGIGVSEGLLADLDKVIAQINDLQDLRGKIDRFEVAVLEAVGQITRLNRSAIALAPELGKTISHSAAARAVQRHAILMTAKDIIGLERATGATGLARAHGAESAVPEEILARFQRLVGERETLLNIYTTLAAAHILEQLTAIEESEAAAQVADIRLAMMARDFEAIRGHSPEDWFQTITTLLGAYKAVEDMGAAEFRDHLVAAAESAESQLLREIGLLAAAFVALALVSFAFVQVSRQSLLRVTERVEGLAKDDIESPVVQEPQPDLAMITRALSQFQEAELLRREQAASRHQLESRLADDISRIVVAVEDGGFDQRIELEDLFGPSEILGQGINTIMFAAEQSVEAQKRRDHEALEEQLQLAAVQKAIVEEINNVVAAFSDGDFNKRVSLEGLEGIWAEVSNGVNHIADTCEAAFGEVSRLLTSMSNGDIHQRMTGEYAGSFAEIRDAANLSFDRLDETFQHIAKSTQRIEDAAMEVGKGTTDLTQRSEGQARAVDTSLAATQALGTTLDENAQKLTECRSLIGHLDTKTQEGQSVTEKAVETITEMESASEEMSKIVATIDDIAFQTNLLALNASVEAARAGEAGKGFAVVASEVRSLSGRCAEASRQIGALIHQSVQQIKDGAGNIRHSGDAMSQIRATMGDVLAMIDTISTAGNQQAEGVRALGTTMTELDATAKSNLALATDNSRLIEDLLTLKTQLQSAVSTFQQAEGSAQIAAE